MGSLLFAGTAGYGEHPSRVILTSFAVIGAFSAYYALLGPGPLTLESLGANLLFSIQSFVTFIVGSPLEPSDITLPISLASSIQAFFGAFLVALFVFSLTRSVNR